MNGPIPVLKVPNENISLKIELEINLVYEKYLEIFYQDLH